MFKITWDKANNGVLLTMRSTEETLNVPPRPVFFEELDLLGLDKHWKYPKSKEPLLWACDRRYFYRGELVLTAKGGNIYDDPELIFENLGKKLTLKPIDIELLCKKNETTMFLLEHEALEFINTIYRRYCPNVAQQIANEIVDFQQLIDTQEKKLKEKYAVIKEDCDSFDIMPLSEAEKQGKQIILNTKIEMLIASFSGGKDSQVVLDLVSRVIPSNDFLVIYSDTGYEIPPSLEIYEQTKAFYQKQYPDLQFYLSKNHQDVLYYWDKFGPPSRTIRWCCKVMKTAPLYKELKKISGKDKQPNVLAFEGVRAEESVSRSQYPRIGKGVKHNNVVSARPILDWNLVEIFLYIFMHKLPMNPAYRKGVTRVGCVICPYASTRGDNLSYKLFPKTIKPFVDKLNTFVSNVGEKDIDHYIQDGLWKLRAGGNNIETNNSITIITEKPDFKAVLNNPQEELFTWLKVLGKYNFTENNGIIIGDLKYKKQIFRFEITKNENSIVVEFKDVSNEILFLSHLKKVLNKTAYCAHCEACEVECPTGALSVEPMVTVDDNKCIHCFKCLDFSDKGCVLANSLKRTESYKKMDTQKSKISRYNIFGLRQGWLSYYFNNIETYFNNDNHGLNTVKQLPRFVTWLRDAEIMNGTDKKLSVLGSILAKHYANTPIKVWEIIWINLAINSDPCKWFIEKIEFSRVYEKAELEVLLQEYFANSAAVTLKVALTALINTFKESPLDKKMKIAELLKNAGKTDIIRQPYNDISPVAVAYSLYRYAESKQRYALTVSELYDEKQTEGIYRQFGVSREELESVLRVLKAENNRVLNADLNMGLDNINLREDLTSMDILEMLL
ncbi:MAG: phosphoadenosine phosphosulfate reductase family protein [Prevotellaceae bacterium]|jgi:3'-phosphoadenosine 5'-phosphosulfate sulfotransferase (PAPS reductase)/FAD synthetase/ferredoxin|nr:phosphoadenosine phosphosulfate reductase family protein [Prevotellaceae bacterium]